MDHTWIDLQEGDETVTQEIRAKKPDGTPVEVHIVMEFIYDAGLQAKKCDRCGMHSIEGKPESDDDCDVYMVRHVMES